MTRIAALLLVALLAGCAGTVDATANYDDSADFAAWRNFTWPVDSPMTVTGGEIGPLTQQYIQNAVERTLGAKGFRLEYDPARADFLVRFTIGEQSTGESSTPPTATGQPSREGPWANTAVQVGLVRTGVLAIDLYDTRTGRRVWQGSASIDVAASRVGSQPGRIDAAVGAILAQFPPGQP